MEQASLISSIFCLISGCVSHFSPPTNGSGAEKKTCRFPTPHAARGTPLAEDVCDDVPHTPRTGTGTRTNMTGRRIFRNLLPRNGNTLLVESESRRTHHQSPLFTRMTGLERKTGSDAFCPCSGRCSPIPHTPYPIPHTRTVATASR